VLRIALIFAVLAALVVGLRSPAAAGITSASLTATSPTTYTGPCPTTVSFHGTVTGTSGTTFSLGFNRYISGAQQIADQGSQIIPAGGTFSINDSVPISASATASTFDQIWVHGIKGGQPDVYSNKVNFSVTCGAPPPPAPAAPTNLKTTTNPGVCGDHVAPLFGGLICGAALSEGDLVLVWDYPDVNTVDGFRIYQVSGGTHTLVDHQSGMTGKALSIKAANAKNLCYVVRAYKGSSESADSNSTCTPTIGIVNFSTIKLPMNGYRYNFHFSHEWFDSTFCLYTRGLGPSFAPSGQQILVGFENFWDAGTQPVACYEKIDHAYRTAIKFDMGPLAGKSIWKATLSFMNQKTNANAAAPATCLSEMMYGINDWSGSTDLIQGESYRDFPTGTNVNVNNPSVKIANSTNYQIDVSDAVRAWVLGSRPNFGFVFRGPNEGYARNNDQCGSFFGNVSLSVQVFN